MFKPFVLGALIALCLILGGKTMASRSQQTQVPQMKRQQTNQAKELEKYQEELPDATPVQHGVLSDKQRAHSKLFSHYRKLMPGGTMSDLVAHAKATGTLIVGARFGGGTQVMDLEPVKPEDFFGKLANSSDAVVMGKVINKESQITEEDCFVFTDYNIKVLEVLKDNKSSPITAGSTITITRPGGKVLLDGVIVNAQDDCFAPLPVNNEVILFLSSVQETGSYKATDSLSSFEFDGTAIRPLTSIFLPIGSLENQNKDTFLQMLHAILGK